MMCVSTEEILPYMFSLKGWEALNECYSIYRCSIYIVPIGARSRYSLPV